MPTYDKDHKTTSAFVQSTAATGTYMYLPTTGSGLFRLLHCEMYTDCTYATQVFVAARWKDEGGSWNDHVLFSGYIDAASWFSMQTDREMVGPFQIYCYLPSINTTTYNVTLKAEWRRIDEPIVPTTGGFSWWR